jgi:hypothetical protein
MLKTKQNKWYVDSGLSSHMAGDKNTFHSFKEVNEGSVTFGDNATTGMDGKGTLVLIMEILKQIMYCMLKGWNIIFLVLVKCVIKDILSHLILKVMR